MWNTEKITVIEEYPLDALNFKYLKIATKLASSMENFGNNSEALAAARGCLKANILRHFIVIARKSSHQSRQSRFSVTKEGEEWKVTSGANAKMRDTKVGALTRSLY